MRSCLTCGTAFERMTISSYCRGCAPLVGDIQAEVRTIMLLAGVPSARGHHCEDCGNPATDRDHRRYGEPLRIAFVCARCNAHRGPALDLPELIAARRNWKAPEPIVTVEKEEPSFSDAMNITERDQINRALTATRWNRTKAAKLLGITFRAMRYRIDKLGLERTI